MIVKKIDIENYKGFEKQEITFNDNLNVFIGANASGKTSILEAIVKCLYGLIKELDYHHTAKEALLEYWEINRGKTHGRLISYIQFDENIIFPIYIVSENNPYNSIRYTSEETVHLHNLQESLSKPRTIPIIRFYPSKREEIIYSLLNRKDLKTYKIPQLETWDNIQENDVSYSRFVRWFHNYENQELRLKLEHNDLSVELPTLKYVRYAVQKASLKLYGKEFVLKSESKVGLGGNVSIPKLYIELEGSGYREDLKFKSDGEKAIITLVADIAYNLALAHNFESDDKYLDSPGIVLIDEIEQHLHPNWQRKIIPILTSVFPKIQFFITTHSPQVISSVKSDHVFVCQDFTVGKMHLKTKGVDSNSLLKFIFNSTERPKEYIDLINEFDELIDKDADISELEHIIEKVTKLEEEDTGSDISSLIGELELQLEAYKFELEHEMD